MAGADDVREVSGGGSKVRCGGSDPPTPLAPPTPLLLPRRGVSRASLKMASLELSLKESGPTRPPWSRPLAAAESMLVSGGGTGM